MKLASKYDCSNLQYLIINRLLEQETKIWAFPLQETQQKLMKANTILLRNYRGIWLDFRAKSLKENETEDLDVYLMKLRQLDSEKVESIRRNVAEMIWTGRISEIKDLLKSINEENSRKEVEELELEKQISYKLELLQESAHFTNSNITLLYVKKEGEEAIPLINLFGSSVTGNLVPSIDKLRNEYFLGEKPDENVISTSLLILFIVFCSTELIFYKLQFESILTFIFLFLSLNFEHLKPLVSNQINLLFFGYYSVSITYYFSKKNQFMIYDISHFIQIIFISIIFEIKF